MNFWKRLKNYIFLTKLWPLFLLFTRELRPWKWGLPWLFWWSRVEWEYFTFSRSWNPSVFQKNGRFWASVKVRVPDGKWMKNTSICWNAMPLTPDFRIRVRAANTHVSQHVDRVRNIQMQIRRAQGMVCSWTVSNVHLRPQIRRQELGRQKWGKVQCPFSRRVRTDGQSTHDVGKPVRHDVSEICPRRPVLQLEQHRAPVWASQPLCENCISRITLDVTFKGNYCWSK